MESIKARCAKYIGVPRVYLGTTPDPGWDCWGLLRYVGVHEFGMKWPSYEEAYAECRDNDDTAVANAIGRHLGEWRLIETPHAGCAICFDRCGMARKDDPRIFHVGLALNSFEMLHVTRNAATSIERFDSFVWGRYFAGARERIA